MSDRRPSKLSIKTKCSACDHYGPHAYGSNPYYNHNGGGTEREANVEEVLSWVRRGVESGTIKGEVVEASYDDDWFASDYALPVAKPGAYVVVGPVSLSEQKTEDQ